MNQSKNNISEPVAKIVDHVIEELSLEDRVTMANLEDDQIEFINKLMAIIAGIELIYRIQRFLIKEEKMMKNSSKQ
jgi:hypothetical protein